MKSLFNDKKGNWQDILEYSRGILILGISILFGFLFINSFNNLFISQAVNNTVLNDTVALANMQGAVTNYPLAVDFIIPILYIFFVGFSAWSARKIPSSYQFLFIGVIALIIVFFFSLFIELMWQSFTEQVSIAPLMSSFPITNFFIGFLRYFVLLYGLIVGVALYAKTE